MSNRHHAKSQNSAPTVLRYRLEKVENKRDLAKFIDVPWTVMAGEKNWIPPLKLERNQLLSKKTNPYFEHAEAAYFLATKDGEPIGRISAQKCDLVQKHMGEGTGQFGFFDCLNDQNLSQDLFDHASDWLRGKGMTRVMGPFNLSINEEVGMLIDGFDTPSCFLMAYNKPYYQELVESAGFTKAKDLYAYWLNIGTQFPENIRKIAQWGADNKRLHIRNINKKNFDSELAIVLDIFNDAWANNWGYIPMTQAEMEKTAKDLKPLLQEHSTRIVEYDGEPVAYMATLPDINRWIADLNGSLLPFGWAKLAYRLLKARPDVVRVPLMGVRQSLQKTRTGGVMALMAIQTIRESTAARGATGAELSWILEDNHAMRDMLVAIGCEIYKTYRVYEKPL